MPISMEILITHNKLQSQEDFLNTVQLVFLKNINFKQLPEKKTPEYQLLNICTQ